ncbi:acetyl esterase/lipase [Streptomyces africanus]|uniref:Acetyl esterase/lipase n=1 Tax=Streptomyces africanus TaxID=231024 RepID=A0ABU0QZ75_9ACTN|nr:alpha/beta hydrolase [Streptomyces africanus]MDQ0751829.1 acetyl esterase/lipase [Streptomyces africanus]
MSAFHPDLTLARFLPKMSYGPVTSGIMRSLKPRPTAPGTDLTVQEIVVPGPKGAPSVSLRVFQPTGLKATAPALLWIHGGGLIFGAPEQDDRTSIAFARQLGITVAAVRYRRASDSPAPAAVEDAYAALRGLVARASELHIDVDRIAIGGASAGGGIAAALALLAHDRAEIRPVFQLLVYPMLDDRTTTRTDLDARNMRLWTPQSNRYGWSSYLGDAVAGPDVSPYAAAARREDLTGLPPAWIGVGTLDLFHDEDVEYARRLSDSNVPCELHIVPGAFHGFDAVFPKADVSQQFWRRQARALDAALSG